MGFQEFSKRFEESRGTLGLLGCFQPMWGVVTFDFPSTLDAFRDKALFDKRVGSRASFNTTASQTHLLACCLDLCGSDQQHHRLGRRASACESQASYGHHPAAALHAALVSQRLH